MDLGNITTWTILVVLGALAVVFFVWTGVRVLRDERIPAALKIVWLAALLAFPVVTSVVWHLRGEQINDALLRGGASWLR